MLIEFSVGNYRSFNEIQTLDMRAAPLRDTMPAGQQHTFQAGKYTLLRCSAVYGANASGKSNLVRAVMFMRQFVQQSATRLQAGDPTGVERFKLDTQAYDRPAYFQIIFILHDVVYRYGFELDEKRVHSEWLYRTRHRESRLFVREGQDFNISGALRAKKDILEMTRPNALFLSVLAQFNHELATEILQWFRTRLRGISGLDDEMYGRYTIERAERDDTFRRRVQTLLRLSDVGITGLGIERIPMSQTEMPSEIQQALRHLMDALSEKRGGQAPPDEDILLERVTTVHPVFDSATGKYVREEIFDMEMHESEGTKKFFYLLGPWIDTLENGYVLFVDEMDARLHPLLTRELVQMFLSPRSNPHNAQLIFATHDVGLLADRLLRRDEVWFTEKNRYGATELYSLAEIKARKDASFYRNYLRGMYGAVPHLGGLQPFVEQEMLYGAHPEAERA